MLDELISCRRVSYEGGKWSIVHKSRIILKPNIPAPLHVVTCEIRIMRCKEKVLVLP